MVSERHSPKSVSLGSSNCEGNILSYKKNKLFLIGIPYTKNIQELFAEGEVNIGEYLPSRRRGKYSPIFTSPEGNNCFSIISELKNRENWIYFHFGDFLDGNLGKSAGSHFVFENTRLRAIFTTLRVFSRDIKLIHVTFHRYFGKLLGHELLMSL